MEDLAFPFACAAFNHLGSLKQDTFIHSTIHSFIHSFRKDHHLAPTSMAERSPGLLHLIFWLCRMFCSLLGSLWIPLRVKRHSGERRTNTWEGTGHVPLLPFPPPSAFLPLPLPACPCMLSFSRPLSWTHCGKPWGHRRTEIQPPARRCFPSSGKDVQPENAAHGGNVCAPPR